MPIHQPLHDTLLLSGRSLIVFVLASIAALAAALLLSKLRRFSARSRHFVLATVFLMPLAGALLLGGGAAARLQALLAAPAETIVGDVVIMDLAQSAERPQTELTEIACILFLVWAVGMFVLLANSTRHWLRWASVARRARAATSHQVARLAISDETTEPMVIGVLRPVIVLPAGYAEALDDEELAAVFAHEREHVRRRDNLTAVLYELVTAIFWFSPIHWMARFRLLELRERACDERVLELGCDASSYARALARSCHVAVESPMVACMSGFHVMERIESIMSYSSDCRRFVSDRLVRVGSAMTALSLLGAFILLAPVPTIASPGGTDYQFDVQLQTGPGERRVARVLITAPDGELVMDARTAVRRDGPVELSTTRGARRYRVEIAPSADDAVAATLEVFDDAVVLQRAMRVVRMYDAEPAIRPAAPPISLNVAGANLHDLLRTFSQLTGRRVIADPALQGTVTISVENTPWDVALSQALAPLGLRAVVRESEIEILPAYKRVGGGVRAPQVLSRVEPLYPAEAKEARVSGVVIIEAAIDETGIVREAKVLKDLPFGLGQAAADAVRQWIFAPATKDGKPVPVVFNLTVNFRLD